MPHAQRPSPSDPLGVPPLFDDAVDLGSWARFTPSLAAFIRDVLRPQAGGGGRAGAAGTGRTLLLMAPCPVVTAESPSPGSRWRRLLRRRPVRPSPEVPGVVVAARADGVEIDVPALDADGRALLGAEHRSQLTTLGWQERTDVLMRLVADDREAAEALTRILIEVLRVPHPADLDHLVTGPE